VRGSIKPFGVRLPASSTPTFARKAAWQIPRELRRALVPILRTIAELTTRIVEFERRIEQIATERYPETVKLRKVNGVGAITSLTYVLTLEDPKRFTKSRAVGAFLGLRPGRSQSGKRDPELHITKAGDRDLRRLLVQSAQYILGPFGSDCDLRRFGLALAARGNKSAKKRALIAVARKLAVLLHRLWLSPIDYDPLHKAEGRNPPRRRRA
jgi:transposase